MKKVGLTKAFSILLFGVLISGCGLTQMTSKYDTVVYTVTPPILQVHGGKVAVKIDDYRKMIVVHGIEQVEQMYCEFCKKIRSAVEQRHYNIKKLNYFDYVKLKIWHN